MDVNLQRIVIPALIVLISSCALLVARRITFGFLMRWAKKTESQLDDPVIKSLRTPSIYWCLAIGLYLGVAFSELSDKYVSHITKAIHVLLILSVTIALANLSGRMFRNYIQTTNLPIPTTGLANGILKGTILILGFLIILSVFGISIAPLITALGISGLAVALALQDTLANLFSGMHILVEKSIRVGDFIRLESGQEGHVEDITWRTTRIRMLPNNMVVIPNHKLAQSIVTNYNLPEQRMSVSIPVAVSNTSDPDLIEKVLLEEAKKAAGEVSGLLKTPEPAVKLISGFGENSLNFSLDIHVREFTDQFAVQHDLRKRILRRFRAEGIGIPVPQRTVYVREEKEWRK